ncbi:MAG: putrescine ABC transporter permease PotI, partial [Gammaproteobacteria bacterium]|nr:putrescine ABC transporter permease PotI [Gammaproteobacteria bacterium]
MRLSRYVFPVMASLGFGFLYAPILILVIYSFNESKLVTVWGGFSTRWYVELFQDPQILDAAKLSLQIAASSATIALVLGVAAAMTLV